MAKELTTGLKASPALTKALESTHRMTGLGGTDQIDFRETWNLPAHCEQLKDEATMLLVDAEIALEPATPDAFRKWVLLLGAMGKGKLDEREVEAKLTAYSMMIIPMACLTPASLKRAAREFKTYGFPSYGELDEFLEEEARPFIQRAERLRQIANAKIELPAKVLYESPTERRNHAAKVMEDLRRKMKFRTAMTETKDTADESS